MILVDTSAFFALADRDDLHHREAKEALEAASRGGEVLLTHNYVVVETAALMQRRLGMSAVRRFLHDLENVLLEWVDRELHDAAVRRFRSGGRRLSLVDCASLELARRNAVRTYIGFDPDFDAEGLVRYRVPKARS
ncbi:MAG: PIN domain-containing protein [Planctomycetes bacterium]|nr:PIN domain-containing protein [Planctomycetota bacterium]